MALPPSARERRPTWEVADLLLPYQGDWTVEEYLKLDTNRLIEFTDGFLEFLPMPDEIHQDVLECIYFAIKAILNKRGRGVARFPVFKVRVRENAFREPDICVLVDDADTRRNLEYWNGADLVVEVVSKDRPERDYEEKRADYAGAGITEYWIVDPRTRTFTLLVLEDGQYRERAVLRGDGTATSVVLKELAIDVAGCFSFIDRAPKSAEDGGGR
jgi:Uma2 family endonuclease